ncbi:MAG: ABC transporter ATP-binding protein [Bacteroidetes bacterium]|nr:ABC transporter ATP-binding protein [Bacteroidota bacterium]
MSVLLKINGLNFKYRENSNGRDNFGLKNINLEINEKDFISVIGKNGSGKSTLIKLISRIVTADSGSILFNGKDILTYDKKELSRCISYLPQSNDLIHFDSEVKDFLMLGRYPYKQFSDFGFNRSDKETVDSAVDITGTQSLLNKKINELSGGERQKVLLTLSVVQLGISDDLSGKLLIIDEPLTHLDINHQMEIMNIIRDLNEKGLTVIIVIHDLNLALKYSGMSALMNNGEVVKYSGTEKVITEEMLKEHFLIDSKIMSFEKNFFINYLTDQ